MYSLSERIEALERDLLAEPMRISQDEALPFAIVQYQPQEEWDLRREMRRCMTRLQQQGKRIVRLSLAAMLWQSIAACEGIPAIAKLEAERGFLVAQNQVTTYLSDPDWMPLVRSLADKLNALGQEHDVVFLWRAAALSPGIYFLSKLLDELRHRTTTPTILFFPGTLEGQSELRFMDLKGRDVLGNYRARIYGRSTTAS